jgi:signal transduction histidine kinase
VVPIYVGRELRGSIGFIQYTDDRDWTDDEVETLQRASDMIAAYWERLDTAEQLRASNESKDRLLSSVSHEIRTPLTAIVGLSEAIVDGSGLAEDEVAELMSIIARQSRELSELVEDLLVASRAGFGNLSIRPEPVDLIGQVRRVVEGLRQGSCKNIQVIGDEVWAWADPLRVSQIIRNLVSNAIKYGGENITVTFQVDPSTVQLVVADDGPGVRAEEAELIFQRYYRSSDSPTLPGSVGIGLAVSRQLAELMSGTLRYVPSEGFVLTLPSLAAGERAATLLA